MIFGYIRNPKFKEKGVHTQALWFCFIDVGWRLHCHNNALQLSTWLLNMVCAFDGPTVCAGVRILDVDIRVDFHSMHGHTSIVVLF